MSVRPIKSVYLSGWEYNRLLQHEPTEPRISALPASILWAGSHQLWMFETIYCTRESFENEVQATEQLGWINGEILQFLANEGIVKTIDWRQLPAETTIALNQRRDELLQCFSVDDIRRAIRSGDVSALETAKAALMEPIMNSLNCMGSGAPNSISTWIRPVTADQSMEVQLSLRSLASSLVPGMQVCRPPGTGVSEAAKKRQQHVQRTVETPFIADLLAGEGEFAGPNGFVPYFRKLLPVVDLYENINSQLRHDWHERRENLLRLREAADKYIWKDLHEYWLPNLVGHNPPTLNFDRWIRAALRIAPIIKFLDNRSTRILIGKLGPFAIAAAANKAGLPLSESIISAGAAMVGASAIMKRFDRASQLALFYQETHGLRRGQGVTH